MRYAIFLSLFVVILGSYSLTFAQDIEALYPTEVTVEMVPENPGPNEVVNVFLSSYATDIDSASIVWEVNGVVKKSGRGEKKFIFTSGPTNSTTVLHIVIRTTEEVIVEKTIRIKPVSVDLIWQTESFVPPFYKGMSYFSHQNEITFVAIPHIPSSTGGEISAKNLNYKWIKDGSVIQDASGLGRNFYTFDGSVISRPINMKVEVVSPDTGGVGFANTTVTPVEPSIVFYKKDPLYGIEFQRALSGTFELQNSKELAVIGMPFFFGTTDPKATELIYKWAVNGKKIEGDNSQTIQVFRQIEGNSGTSNISMSIENANKILQYASNNFNLKFWKKSE